MSLELLTILDKDGKAQKGKDPNLPAAELQKLYRLMVTTRALDDRGLALQRQGRIGFYLQSTGQEASHLGSAYALKDSDWLFPAYRQPGILLLRQVPIEKIVCEWFGNAGDTSKGRQMPVHYSFRQANFVSISSPIGTQLTQAAGAGMAARIRGDDTVFMTYCGDGGTSSNVGSCVAYGVSRRCSFENANTVIGDSFGVFHHDHCVTTIRNRRTRHYANGGSFTYCYWRHCTSGYFTNDFQLNGDILNVD